MGNGVMRWGSSTSDSTDGGFHTITMEEIGSVCLCWKVILDDECLHFWALRGSLQQEFKYSNCLAWFCTIVLDCLRETHPDFEVVEKHIRKFLSAVISVMFTLCIEDIDFTTLIRLSIPPFAVVVDLEVVREAVAWALGVCVGSHFGPAARRGWRKLYNQIVTSGDETSAVDDFSTTQRAPAEMNYLERQEVVAFFIPEEDLT